MEQTSIRFCPAAAAPEPSLSCRVGLEGNIRFLHQQGFWIAAEDNEPERVEVHVTKKRNLHVITDTDLRFQKIRDDELPEHLSGLRLSLYPV